MINRSLYAIIVLKTPQPSLERAFKYFHEKSDKNVFFCRDNLFTAEYNGKVINFHFQLRHTACLTDAAAFTQRNSLVPKYSVI